MISKYITPEYHSDNIDSILDYAQYGNCIYSSKLEWKDDSARTDIIEYDDTIHCAELKKDLRFDDLIDDATKSSIVDII